MTGAQALNILMARLGNRTAAVLRTNLLTEMLFAQQQLERGAVLPWFLTNHDYSLGVTAATRAVALPSDFLRETEVPWRLINSSGVESSLIKKDYDYLNDFYGSTATADLPLHYALVGRNLYAFALPTTTLAGKFDYKQAQVAPTDDSAITNQWLAEAPDVLIGKVGMVAASQYIKDTENYVFFKDMYSEGWARMLTENTVREEAARDRAMG